MLARLTVFTALIGLWMAFLSELGRGSMDTTVAASMAGAIMDEAIIAAVIMGGRVSLNGAAALAVGEDLRTKVSEVTVASTVETAFMAVVDSTAMAAGSMAVVEAMAAGMVVVATEAGITKGQEL